VVNSPTGRDSKSLEFRFKSDQRESPLTPLAELSQGEKCLVISSALAAWASLGHRVVCFWDEPDNFISLDRVGDFILQLRRGFEGGNQLIATSHNPEAIRKFTRENTLLLRRDSHMESTSPAIPGPEIEISGDLANSIARGEVFASSRKQTRTARTCLLSQRTPV
jgi:hypothetical protein